MNEDQSTSRTALIDLLTRVSPAAGDAIPPERELADQLAISRKTVRDTLTDLESRGIIRKAGRRARVMMIDLAGSRDPSGARVAVGTASRSRLVCVVVGPGSQAEAHTQPGWSYHVSSGASFGVGASQRDVYSVPVSRVREVPDVAQLATGCGVLLTSVEPLPPEANRRIASIVPCVTWRHPEPDDGTESMDRVLPDHDAGTQMLVKALVERGCRRIVQIVSPKHRTGWWAARRTGYESAAAACGIVALPPNVVPTPAHLNDANGSSEAFADMVRHYAGYLVEYLRDDNRADAILAAGDASVPALAEACRLFRLEPNKDVLLAGFDNLLEGHWTYNVRPFKPVFTIDKQNFQIGLTMADILSQRINGQLAGPPHSVVIAPKLVTV